QLVKVRECATELSSGTLEYGWLGRPGATEAAIAATEQRLEKKLPPSYRAFLNVTNGWGRTTAFIEHIWPVEQIKPSSIENYEWVDIWQEIDPDCPEGRYLPSALQISEVGDAAVYLLVPDLVAPNGEWEAWFLSSWRGETLRYPSFWDLMQAEYSTFKRL